MRCASLASVVILVVLAACEPKAAPATDVAPSSVPSSTPSSAPSVPASLASAPPFPGPPASALAALHADTGVTVESLASFCGSDPCDRFDVALQRLREETTRARDAGTCAIVEAGTCGGLRYLLEASLQGTARFYDASGALVAVMQDNLEHPGQRWFGPRQACSRVRTEDLCNPRRPTGSR